MHLLAGIYYPEGYNVIIGRAATHQADLPYLARKVSESAADNVALNQLTTIKLNIGQFENASYTHLRTKFKQKTNAPDPPNPLSLPAPLSKIRCRRTKSAPAE